MKGAVVSQGGGWLSVLLWLGLGLGLGTGPVMVRGHSCPIQMSIAIDESASVKDDGFQKEKDFAADLIIQTALVDAMYVNNNTSLQALNVQMLCGNMLCGNSRSPY
eukprot:1335523-Amorphochlora_amoeboformis.AAC.1